MEQIAKTEIDNRLKRAGLIGEIGEAARAKWTRECHKAALIGEKATPAQIHLWKSLGILPK